MRTNDVWCICAEKMDFIKKGGLQSSLFCTIMNYDCHGKNRRILKQYNIFMIASAP